MRLCGKVIVASVLVFSVVSASAPTNEELKSQRRIKRQSDWRLEARRRNQRQQQPGAELIFSRNPQQQQQATPPPPPFGEDFGTSNTPVFINNQPTVATMPPFAARTTPSPQFLACFNSCPTTPEYNPICGSNQQLYFNEQKFNCALRCGQNVQIVRRGSCEGLFPMVRG